MHKGLCALGDDLIPRGVTYGPDFDSASGRGRTSCQSKRKYPICKCHMDWELDTTSTLRALQRTRKIANGTAFGDLEVRLSTYWNWSATCPTDALARNKFIAAGSDRVYCTVC